MSEALASGPRNIRWTPAISVGLSHLESCTRSSSLNFKTLGYGILKEPNGGFTSLVMARISFCL